MLKWSVCSDCADEPELLRVNVPPAKPLSLSKGSSEEDIFAELDPWEYKPVNRGLREVSFIQLCKFATFPFLCTLPHPRPLIYLNALTPCN